MALYENIDFGNVVARSLTVNGVPVFGGNFAGAFGKNAWFVDGTHGSDGNDGLSSTTAFATITKAVAKATGGDVIYINPQTYKIGTGFNRYTEDVTITIGGVGGSGITASNANISLVGITSRRAPTDFLGVRWVKATATNLTVQAPGTNIENIGFFAEGATYGVYFQGDGATWTKAGHTGSSLYNCAIKGEGGVFANGADELQIVNCRFQAKFDGTTSGMIITVDGTNVCRRPILRGCTFIGGNGTAMATAPIIWTGGVADGLIADNYFGLGTSVQINIATASTGLITRNYFAEANLSTTFIVQNGMVAVANYDLTGLNATV